ncbi:MAG: hypothetical protein D6820_00225 [Lentisphaerae bacterium]|nr:MAG: hypothetical protein D6820_00225 [Lentisphaerota bacterium]
MSCPHCPQPAGRFFPDPPEGCPAGHTAWYAPCPFCCPAASMPGACPRWRVVADSQQGSLWQNADARDIPDIVAGHWRWTDQER